MDLKELGESSSTSNDNVESKTAGEEDDNTPVRSPSFGVEHPRSRRGVMVTLVVDNAEKFGEFFCKATGAQPFFPAKESDGQVWHGALELNGVTLLLEEFGHAKYQGEKAPHVRLHLNSDDPTSIAKKLKAAGAKTLNECEPQSRGSTWGVFTDPFGITWSVSTSSQPIGDVPKELERKVMPLVMVRDSAAYLEFISEVFGAEGTSPAAEGPDGKIRASEVRLNGGLIVVSDQNLDDDRERGPGVGVSCEVPAGHARPICEAFEANGGEAIVAPAVHSQGEVWSGSKDILGNVWYFSEPCPGSSCPHEGMDMETGVGEKYDWKWKWVLEDVPPRHCFGEVRACLSEYGTVSATMREMLPKAFEAAAQRGIHPAGPVVAAYYSWDSKEGGETRFTCGPTVAVSSPEAEGDGFGVRTVTGCRCATTIHTGPYSELSEAYRAIFEWIAAKGFDSRMPCVEIHLNGPHDTEPSDLRTQICIPVVPKGSS